MIFHSDIAKATRHSCDCYPGANSWDQALLIHSPGTWGTPGVYIGMIDDKHQRTAAGRTHKARQFAEVLLLSTEGVALTLMVLMVLAVLGVPPYARILTDLRGLVRLLIG